MSKLSNINLNNIIILSNNDLEISLAREILELRKKLSIEGFVFVPLKPTKEMIKQVHPITSATCMNCGCDVHADCEQNILWSWDDMLKVVIAGESAQ